MELSNKNRQIIEAALDANTECQKGILNGERIFTTTRNGKDEILVLIYSGNYRDTFLHLAFINQKWVTSFVCVDGYIIGNNGTNIIEDFWTNINTRIGWDLPFVPEDSVDSLMATNIEDAMNNLIEMIHLYRVEEYGGAKSFDVYDVYGSEPMIAGSNNTRYEVGSR
jgi:hypothetical protein